MRDFTTMSLLSAACVAMLFTSCQKSELVPTTITPSVSNKVFELKNHNFDNLSISPSLLPQQNSFQKTNTARFVITYFDALGGEKEKIFNQSELRAALIQVGLSEQDAYTRTKCMFRTNNCSPVFLTQTAMLIAPLLPPHTEDSFICEMYRPYDVGITNVLQENRTQDNSETLPIVEKENTQSNRIQSINKLVGVSGNIAIYGSNRIELSLNKKNLTGTCAVLVEPQSVRLALRETRGYIEGEATYVKLILGELTEHDVWKLFENEVIPTLQQADSASFEQTEKGSFFHLTFRYNYVEIGGSNGGRLGYTIYDLEGYKNTTTTL